MHAPFSSRYMVTPALQRAPLPTHSRHPRAHTHTRDRRAACAAPPANPRVRAPLQPYVAGCRRCARIRFALPNAHAPLSAPAIAPSDDLERSQANPGCESREWCAVLVLLPTCALPAPPTAPPRAARAGSPANPRVAVLVQLRTVAPGAPVRDITSADPLTRTTSCRRRCCACRPPHREAPRAESYASRASRVAESTMRARSSPHASWEKERFFSTQEGTTARRAVI
ncbi:hypothetical protein B0H15DRAFT_954999 [Mycena belliarum]|uniref:Uncharacterized protein n=1 Tax=Mycena belliarum TaxID=1033014 RepID=A0AAD6TS61_9AGAR|nr:hypothetical protein B0H15DRAFT_954999 [Mycena belliae]